jgi:hypothetical protein
VNCVGASVCTVMQQLASVQSCSSRRLYRNAAGVSTGIQQQASVQECSRRKVMSVSSITWAI